MASPQTIDRETGELLEQELPGMPERPGPLWGSDAVLDSAPVRTVAMSLGGSIALISAEPGHHVLAEGLRAGAQVYLQVEGVVSKRGVGSGGGFAAVKVTSAVRADEAGVIELQETLDEQTRHYRALAVRARILLDHVGSYLPTVPRANDDSAEAHRARTVLAAVDGLRLAAGAALAD